MIIAYVGTPGAGKSYDAAKAILKALMQGFRVYTNIEGMDTPVCQKFLQDYSGLDDFEFKKLFHFKTDKEIENCCDYVKDNSLVVIDEIHKRFSNRDWQTEKNKKFADWCSTHRHHGIEMIFVTQDMEKVEKHVRSLIEWSYVYRQINFLGSLVKNKYCRYSYSGDCIGGKPIATNSYTYDLRVFNTYKSTVSKDLKKLNLNQNVNILKHPVFFAIPCLIAVFLWMFFTKSSFATGDLFGSDKAMHRLEKKKINAVETVKAPFVPRPYATVPAVTGAGVFSAPSSSSRASSPVRQSLVPVKENIFVKGVVSDFEGKFRLLLSDGRMVVSKKSYPVGSLY